MRRKSPNLEPGCPKLEGEVLVVAGLKPKKLLPDVRDTPKECRGVRASEPRRVLPLAPHPLPLTRLLGGHSEVDPRLPIPNRTVKRLCADASADCPRESRSPPGAPNEKAHPARGGPFCLAFLMADLLSERKHTACKPQSKQPTACAYEGHALTGVGFSAG